MKDAMELAEDLRQAYGENFCGYLIFRNGNSISIIVIVNKLLSPRIEESARIMSISKQYIDVDKASIIEVKELKKFLKDKKVYEYYGNLLMVYDASGSIFKTLL